MQRKTNALVTVEIDDGDSKTDYRENPFVFSSDVEISRIDNPQKEQADNS